MSLENIFAITFLILLTLYLIKIRKKIQIQGMFPVLYFALYRTKLGLKQMDSIGKRFPKFIHYLSLVGVYIGFLGMILISFMLIKNIWDLFMVPDIASGVALVLPFKVAGGFYVPFTYWILSIFVIATIHEFSHGVVARANGVKVKSSGFAFLGIVIPIIPAAFVEPEEKALLKQPLMKKLAVFSAGPFSNILTAFIFLGALLLLAIPIGNSIVDFDGVKISGFTENSSSELAGLKEGSVITSINGISITHVTNLSSVLIDKNPGDLIVVNDVDVTLGKNPLNESKPYLGVLLEQSTSTKESFSDRYGSFTATFILWLFGLLTWLYLLSLGIGLFNLVPIGPVDGGQMLREVCKHFIKDQKKAMKLYGYISMFFLVIILILIFSGFI